MRYQRGTGLYDCYMFKVWVHSLEDQQELLRILEPKNE